MNNARGSRIATGLAALAALLVLPSGAFAQVPAASNARRRAPVRAALRVQLPNEARALVVGQAVPVTIRAEFLGGTGVTLNGVPRLASDGFTLAGVSDKPRQTEVRRDGLPYTELTWTGLLTAIQAGAAPPAIELPVELSYREPIAAPPPPDNPGDQDDDQAANPFASMFAGTPFASDPFFAQVMKGDPFSNFFQDFGGAVRQRDVTLRDQLARLTVAAPPTPTPARYGGAVGTFHAASSLSAAPFRVGEPLTLTLRVDGRGSFDRLATPGVPASDDLSTYPPSASFTAGNEPGAGTKVFTQTLVPRKAGSLEIPAVTLVTFDPQRHRYVTQRTRPLSVTIAPAADAQPEPTAAATAPDRPARAADSPASIDDTARSLIPAIRQPWFWWVAAALVAAGLLASLLGSAVVRGGAARALGRLDRRRRLARTRRRMDAAVAAGDPTALFGAARDGLQACLAQAWSMPPAAISAADVSRRLGDKGQGVREIFERADACAYGRSGRPAPQDLQRWRDVAARELDALKEVA
ncbi:MAG TPA: BatD family protein [Polyangia bacterium]|nr:BatD family protein [Polyangia bacterium]